MKRRDSRCSFQGGHRIFPLAVLLLFAAAGCSSDDDPAQPDETTSGVTVTIISPVEGSTYDVIDTIDFTGGAVDDGLTPITGAGLIWTSDLDGAIGTGTSYSAQLSEGDHTITLAATTADGSSGQASVHISVESGVVTADLLGTWQYSTSGGWSSGLPWPVPAETSGLLTISAVGNAASLSFDSGFVCDPAFTCLFSGAISGDTFTGSNSGVVDGEGGTVANTLTVTATSATTAAGSSGSVYQLDDVSGQWGYTIQLVRPD